MIQIEPVREVPRSKFTTGSDCQRVKNLFTSRSHFLTPAAAGHAAKVLYVPVSQDPEVTGLCSSVLSDAELQRADRFVTQGDKALFIQRRAFRRFCCSAVLGSSQPLSQIEFDEKENGRPQLAGLPDVWLSFSSCRFGFVGAWSATHAIGVDLEDPTRELKVTELARQFFSAAEARAVEGQAGMTNLGAFFQFWCLKEAALKSIGEGLPFGLDAFEFELEPNLRVVHAPLDHGGPDQFIAHMLKGSNRCAALVIRSLA